MNLIRTAFWLSIVILLLPTGRDDKAEDSASKVSLNQAVSAASDTASDLVGFCGRNPAVCETGQNAVKVFADKAKYGASMLYEWAAGTNTAAVENAPVSGAQPDIAGKMDPIDGADRLRSSPGKSNLERQSQNTLSREDLEPAWKGPGDNA